MPELLADPATIDRRIRTLSSRLGLDADRVLRWGYAQAVLSAIWVVEDGYVLDPSNPSLQLAHALEPMSADF
jgi:streptomycin 6-kinase